MASAKSISGLSKYTLVRDVVAGSRNLAMQVIILELQSKMKTKDGHTVYRFLVADDSGSIELVLWDDSGASMNPGDIVRISSGYATLYRNVLAVYTGRLGTIERMGEFTMTFNEHPNFSHPTSGTGDSLVKIPLSTSSTQLHAKPVKRRWDT